MRTNPQDGNERPQTVRRRKADLAARVNGDLHVAFNASGLTSYAGLEPLIHYLRSMELNGLIRRYVPRGGIGSDFGVVALVRLTIGMLVVGGTRLRHVGFLDDDPMIGRFCGLRTLPTARTLSRWLKQFTAGTVRRLAALNAEVVAQVIARKPVKTLSVDIDGTVVCTGLQVERAFRGFNPHHRRVPSYYPITACIGETGHVLRVKNRSGDVHDGKASIGFLRDVFAQVDETLGSGHRLNFRMDGAFFRQDVIRLLEGRDAGFAIKVPFHPWLGLKRRVTAQKVWTPVTGDVDGFSCDVTIKPWGMNAQMLIYRKRVFHQTRKNFQLDLFDPDDGYFEYSAVTTNLQFDVRRIWYFMCGRGQQEKIIGELKNGFAFDTIPTNHYGANSAWQQLSALAYNLLLNFQIDRETVQKPRSRKRTAMYVVRTARELRFKLLHRAGQVVRPRGVATLRLAPNPEAERLFRQMSTA